MGRKQVDTRGLVNAVRPYAAQYAGQGYCAAASVDGAHKDLEAQKGYAIRIKEFKQATAATTA